MSNRCRGCSGTDFNLSRARVDLSRTLGKLDRNPNSPKLKAYATELKAKFDAEKAKHAAHLATHETEES